MDLDDALRDWTDAQWRGRARMAAARRHAGEPLDKIDDHALWYVKARPEEEPSS